MENSKVAPAKPDHTPRNGTGIASSRPKTSAVHALVMSGDIVAIAVENERRPPLPGADHLFGRLAPARVRHGRIDVRPEAIFGRLQGFPHALGPRFGEAETYDRLDRFE